jgi:hypothetical protein
VKSRSWLIGIESKSWLAATPAASPEVFDKQRSCLRVPVYAITYPAATSPAIWVGQAATPRRKSSNGVLSPRLPFRNRYGKSLGRRQVMPVVRRCESTSLSLSLSPFISVQQRASVTSTGRIEAAHSGDVRNRAVDRARRRESRVTWAPSLRGVGTSIDLVVCRPEPSPAPRRDRNLNAVPAPQALCRVPRGAAAFGGFGAVAKRFRQMFFVSFKFRHKPA